MTYYLKYRPQTIAELDLDKVRDQLSKIVQSGRIPHAFLFAGPRGSGKTSTARILAKVLNCEHPQLTTHNSQLSTEPCNECDTCISITKGNSMDVIEIDAASNRGVDDIRSLRETVKLSPAGSKKKVYIIDEAHMLTTEAANALLKTLEEPPAHAVFILATTEPHKLIETIRSRCTIVTFYKGSKKEILRSLQKIVDGEKLDIEEKALEAIARGVDGSFREAHKVLEQLSFSGEKITEDAVKSVFSGSSSTPQRLLELMGLEQTKEALEEIDRIVENGANLRSYTTQAVGILRQLLLRKAGILVEQEEIAGLEEQKDLTELVELFSDCYRQLPLSVIPQLPLEMVVFKWSTRMQKGAVGVPGGSKKVGKVDGIEDVKKANGVGKIENVVKVENKAGNVVQSNELVQNSVSDILTAVLEDVEPETLLSESIVTKEELENAWREIMKQTRIKNTSLEALLRACRPESFDGKVLKIEVFYKFHKEKLEQTLYRDLVETISAGVFGASAVRLICSLTNERKKGADVANVVVVQGQDDLGQLAEQIFGAPSDGKIH